MAQHRDEGIVRLIVETIDELADFENPPELVTGRLRPLARGDEHALVTAIEAAVAVLGSHLSVLETGGRTHDRSEVREWSAIAPSSVKYVNVERLGELLLLAPDAEPRSMATAAAVRSIVEQARRECGAAYGGTEVLLTAVLAAAGAQRERRLREAQGDATDPFSRFNRQRVLCLTIERVFFGDVSPRMAAERLAAVSPTGPDGRYTAVVLREALAALGSLMLEHGRLGGIWDPATIVASARAAESFDWDGLPGQLVDAPLEDLLQAAVFIGAGHVGAADELLAVAEQGHLVRLLAATLALIAEAVDRVRRFDAAGVEWAWGHVPRQGVERLNQLTDGTPTEVRDGTTWVHEWTVSYAGHPQLIRAHAQLRSGGLYPAVEAYGLDDSDDDDNDWELLTSFVPIDPLLYAGHDHDDG